tara:strand:+ start:2470 stop:2592 length:123 start_codon:yes stop_codon:yes gene_type:complete
MNDHQQLIQGPNSMASKTYKKKPAKAAKKASAKRDTASAW